MKSANVSFDLKRFSGIKRDYSKEDIEKLKGTFNIEYTLCKSQSDKLWSGYISPALFASAATCQPLK